MAAGKTSTRTIRIKSGLKDTSYPSAKREHDALFGERQKPAGGGQ